MKIQLQASIILVALLLSLSLISVTYAETYSYDNSNRLIGVVYADASAVSYNFDANGNLLALTSAGAAPVVSIVGGSRTIADADGIAGESLSLSATVTVSDGTVETTQWLINDVVVATGLTATIALPDGQTIVTFKATDDGVSSMNTVTIIVTPPLASGWPVPYSGITPDESLGLAFNNISALNPQDGLIYSCLRILSNGLLSSLAGIDRFDIAFEIISTEQGTLGVVRTKPFNGSGALNEKGELPDCSGSLELTTNIYEDIIQVGAQVYSVKMQLVEGAGVTFRILEANLLGATP